VQEHANPEECDRFLRRAVEQFEKTLTIDSEDLDAHFGLGQCYLRIGQNVAGQFLQIEGGSDQSADLAERAKEIANANLPQEQRVQAALRLALTVQSYGEKPADPEVPKLLVLQKLIDQCLSSYKQEMDPEISAAIAFALGQLHLQAHAVVKTDDNAADRTMALYRQKHPAAAKASQPIVIYPLNRQGAPKVDLSLSVR
jgi:hypothetical protein